MEQSNHGFKKKNLLDLCFVMIMDADIDPISQWQAGGK